MPGNILGDGWEGPMLCEIRKETSYGLYENIRKSYFFPNVWDHDGGRNNFVVV